MTLKIDKAGRLILSKPVRDRLHLNEGSELELEERSDGIVLRPANQQQAWKLENGLLVFVGKPARGFDWDKAIEDVREERIKETSGL